MYIIDSSWHCHFHVLIFFLPISIMGKAGVGRWRNKGNGDFKGGKYNGDD
jgi:hypothetical protein